jgi:hypothetical protein
VLAGDFFEHIPERADCYVLANVLHDWDDTRATKILRNCRRSMPRAGRVLIIERLIPEDGSDAVPNPPERHQHARDHRRGKNAPTTSTVHSSDLRG